MKKNMEMPDFGWQMKSLASAETSFEVTKNGVYDLRIVHSTIKGVSPKMLEWWFRNIGGEMTYRGHRYPRYLIWHPLDHIHWELVGQKGKAQQVGVGSYFRIVEAFANNPSYQIDSIERVEKLDITGIRLVRRILGIEIFSLEHHFGQAGTEGSSYRSQMLVGSDHWLMGPLFNKLIRPFIFSKIMGRLWLKHNIEEVGNFEFFLPELYRQYHPQFCDGDMIAEPWRFLQQP